MNERIEELAKQTDSNCNAKLPDYTQRWNQMFAQLIVKECAQSIEKTIEITCDTDSEKMGCEFAITDLLQHFGVKK